MSCYDNGFARAQWEYEHRMPPEPEPCCSLAEDDPDHDTQACLAAGAEDAAEAKAERQREETMDQDWRDEW